VPPLRVPDPPRGGPIGCSPPHAPLEGSFHVWPWGSLDTPPRGLSHATPLGGCCVTVHDPSPAHAGGSCLPCQGVSPTKRSHSKNRGGMTVGLGGLGPPAYPISPHKSVGLGFRKGPCKGTPFRRPYGNHWMRLLARYTSGCLSWRQPLGPPGGRDAVVAD